MLVLVALGTVVAAACPPSFAVGNVEVYSVRVEEAFRVTRNKKPRSEELFKITPEEVMTVVALSSSTLSKQTSSLPLLSPSRIRYPSVVLADRSEVFAHSQT